MALADLIDWLNRPAYLGASWYVKRLSANDTQANGSHQAGPYIPKAVVFQIFPSINRPLDHNPDSEFRLVIDSHADDRTARVVWYNGRSRNETRITRLGGASSALLDPENTGALVVLAFSGESGPEPVECRAWVCRDSIEEEIVEDRVGPVHPGQWVFRSADRPDIFAGAGTKRNCWLSPDQIPSAWMLKFPSGEDIISLAVKLRSDRTVEVDQRLISRRECEFQVFRSVEEAVESPRIRGDFKNLEEFITLAQSILQRRKARSGRSLELHVRKIFEEEGLVESQDFSWQGESEQGKLPDFLFPNERSYKNPRFPERRLRMLATKTTCKDRWRQVLNEADRIRFKHLLTLQEGVSQKQFNEMLEAGVRLVVPRPLHSKYPESVRPHLISLTKFLNDVGNPEPGAAD